jgi:4-amino-4-deoxy-L-arabinose transferase-like glycosyltransferase
MFLRDFSPDNELKYLSIADEAIENGQFFAFTNHGAPYADKPPLYLWIVMLGRALFGNSCMPFLALFSLIPAYLIIWAVDDWLRKSTGLLQKPLERAGAALILLTCFLFLGCSIFVRMDMLMCLFIILALRSFWMMYSGIGSFKKQSFLLPIWIFLAVFTKGPVGLLMPPITIICFLLIVRKGRLVGKYLGWKTWGIIAGLCLLWFAGVYADGGKSYLSDLLFHQTFGRAVNSFHHKAPIYYYFITIWYSIAPWCLLLAGALIASFFNKEKSRSELETFFLTGIVATFVMLTAFSGKLAIYMLPIYPLMAYLFIFIKDRFGWRSWMKWSLAVPMVLLAIVGIAGALALTIFKEYDIVRNMTSSYSFATSPLIVIGLIILATGSIYSLILTFRSGWEKPVIAQGVTILLFAFTVSFLMPKINDYAGFGNFAKLIPDGAEVVAVNIRSAENMDVYLGRTVKDYGKDLEGFQKDLGEGKITAEYLITDANRFRKVKGIEEYVSSMPHKACGTYWLVALEKE